MSAREVILDALVAHVGDGQQAAEIIDAFCADTAKALTAAGYRIIAPGELDGLLRSLQRAEDGAGTLPAKEAVKLRPADWHAVSSAIRALAGKAGEA